MNSPTIKKKTKKKSTAQGFELHEIQMIPRSKTMTLHVEDQGMHPKIRKASAEVDQDGQNNYDMTQSTNLGESMTYGGLDESVLYKKNTVGSLENNNSIDQCQFCWANGMKQVRHRPGQTTVFWGVGLTPLLLCWLPFLVKGCQNQEKWCTSCKKMTDIDQPRCL